ncbi:MAG: magnesium transporter [Candidatus Omnitrophica bacterium]|nr:magnesium transporter [Candidatus Omnitrophota bacterium]
MKFFIYLSELLGRPVRDSQNKFMGRIFDFSMNVKDEVFPKAQQVIIRKGNIFSRRYAAIPTEVFQVTDDLICTAQILLKDIKFEKERFRPDLSVRTDILDQQVVDTNGRKVVRVNDVHLLKVDKQFYLAHVDVGTRGLIRRLEWTPFVDAIVKLIHPDSLYLSQEMLISWKHTHVLNIGSRKNVVRSDVEMGKLAKIPSAELADIMEDLDIFEKLSLFKVFGVEMQRKIFTDMTLQEKEDLIDHLEEKEASSLLENIPADEATDLLKELPKDKRSRFLRMMQSKTSKALLNLLGFKQDTAGGLMTTEYLYLNSNATVGDAIQKVKDNVAFPGNVYTIYLVDEKHHLLGVTVLKRFINEPPEKLLSETCYHTKIFVRTDDTMEEIAVLLEKYKFLALPVLDDEDILQGVITIDDVMEELIALTWKKYRDQI